MTCTADLGSKDKPTKDEPIKVFLKAFEGTSLDENGDEVEAMKNVGYVRLNIIEDSNLPDYSPEPLSVGRKESHSRRDAIIGIVD